MNKTKKSSPQERVKAEKPIEVWASKTPGLEGWTWEVLKKYQKPEEEAKNPLARFFCRVLTPYDKKGECHDVFVVTLKALAMKKVTA